MKLYTFSYDSSYEPSAPVLTMVVSWDQDIEERLVALIDSGADATMIPVHVLRNVGARYIGEMRMRGVLGVSQIVDIFVVNVRVGAFTINGVEAIAVLEGSEAIVGRDVLNNLIVTLNGLANTAEISG